MLIFESESLNASSEFVFTFLSLCYKLVGEDLAGRWGSAR